MGFWTLPEIQNHGLEMGMMGSNLQEQLEGRMWQEMDVKLVRTLQRLMRTLKLSRKTIEMKVPLWEALLTTGESTQQAGEEWNIVP